MMVAILMGARRYLAGLGSGFIGGGVGWGGAGAYFI